MQHIQWYPGHMTKAVRMMENSVKLVDAVLYVVDSRAVSASKNPKFDELFGHKKVLYIFNKSDLVDFSDLKPWLDKFAADGKNYVVTDCASGDVGQVVEGLRAAVSEMLDRYKERGVEKTVRAMVVGIPNSGKSTLINSLCRAKKTLTGDRPGVTRGGQWVRVGEHIDLFDTPGTLWAAFENQDEAHDLAYIGSIKDDVLDVPELALSFISKVREIYPDALKNRYKITLEGSDLDVLESIVKARGFLIRGGEPDYERGAKAVLDDFRKGRLGKIMLEHFKDEDSKSDLGCDGSADSSNGISGKGDGVNG